MSKMDKMQMILDLNTQLQLSYPPSKKMKECWTPETMVLPNAPLPLLPSAPVDTWLSPNLLRPFYSIQDNMREFWYPKDNDNDDPSSPPQSSSKENPRPPDPYKKRISMLVIAGISLLIIIFVIVVLIYVRYTKFDKNVDEPGFTFMSANQSIAFTNSTDKVGNKEKDPLLEDYQQFLFLQYKNLTEHTRKLQQEVEKYKSEMEELKKLYNQCKTKADSTSTVPMYTSTIKPQKGNENEVPFYYTSNPPTNLEQGEKRNTKELYSTTTLRTTERASSMATTAYQDSSIRIAHNSDLKKDSGTPTTNDVPLLTTTSPNGKSKSTPTNFESTTGANDNVHGPQTKGETVVTSSTLDADSQKKENPRNQSQNDSLSKKNEIGDTRVDDRKNNADNNEKSDSGSEINTNDRNKQFVTEKYQNSYDFSTPILIETSTPQISTTIRNVVTELDNDYGNVVSENVIFPSEAPKIQDQKRNNEKNNDDGQSNVNKDSTSLTNDNEIPSSSNSDDSGNKKPEDEAGKKNDRKGRGFLPVDGNQTNQSPNMSGNETTNKSNNQATSGNSNIGKGNYSDTDELHNHETNRNKSNDFNKPTNGEKENHQNTTMDKNEGGFNGDERENKENFNDDSKYKDSNNLTNNQEKRNDEKKENESIVNEMKNKTDQGKEIPNESNKMDDINHSGKQTELNDNKTDNMSGNVTHNDKKEVNQDVVNKDQDDKINKDVNEGNNNSNNASDSTNKENNSDVKGKSDDGNTTSKNLAAGDNVEKDKSKKPNDGKKNELFGDENILYEKPRKKGKSKDHESIDEEKGQSQKNEKNDDDKRHKDKHHEQNPNEDDGEETGPKETISEENDPAEKKDHNKEKGKKEKIKPSSPSPPPKDKNEDKHKSNENGGTRKPALNDDSNKTSNKEDESNKSGEEREINNGEIIPNKNATKVDRDSEKNRYKAHWEHYKTQKQQNSTREEMICIHRKNFTFPFSHQNNSCYLNFTSCEYAGNQEADQLENAFQYNSTCLLLLLDTRKEPTTAIMPGKNSNYILSIAGNHSGTFSIVIGAGENILLQVEVSEIGDEGNLARIIFSSNYREKSKRNGNRVWSEEVHSVKQKRRGEFAIVIFSDKDYYKIYMNNFGGQPLKYRHRLKEDNAVRVKFRGAVTVNVLTFEILNN